GNTSRQSAEAPALSNITNHNHRGARIGNLCIGTATASMAGWERDESDALTHSRNLYQQNHFVQPIRP
ncbi:hypothetical protein ALP78_04667, partial [Pseudomonas coronafaciens pv. striafaciens]